VILNLTSTEQAKTTIRHNWEKITKALDAGKHLTIEIKLVSKTREQEEKYHAMIGDIAKQAQHMGAKWSAEDWKRLLVDQFARDSFMYGAPIVPNLDGTGIVQLGVQTRKFTKEQASEFVEWLYSWAANNGIDL
jgi:CTP synthase (UTP-ammonia lyase)